MPTQRLVTVVNILSPSYTGTTWFGLLLGSHPRVFTLGAPDRVWKLRAEGEEHACRVHGNGCPFWSTFMAERDPAAAFYPQLAEASGRDVIVINNPSTEHAAAELNHPDITVRPVRIVRDGRALASSYARHHDVDFIDAVTQYVRNVYRDFPFDPDDPDVPALRYEDLVADQPAHLARLGAYLGLEYAATAPRFWEFEHHVTAGNAGAISLLKSFQGLDDKAFRNRPFYQEQYERMREEGGAFLDERWKEELGSRERFVFDHFCGRDNAAWGYDEDAFTASQREKYNAELAIELRPVESWFAERRKTIGWSVRRAATRLVDRVPRSRRKLLVLLLLAWIVSLVVTGLLVAWLVGAVASSR